MKSLVWIVFCLTICSSLRAQADHEIASDRALENTKYPGYAVPVRKEDSQQKLDEVDEGFFSVKRPYAEARPDPFYYRADVERHRADPDLKKVEPFLMGGVNCDDTIKKIKTITGVRLDFLTERAKGHPDRAQFGARKGPAWEGINNTMLRSSGDGFIKPGQTMRGLLLEDNATVRSMGLTHQKVAEPMLMAFEALHRAIVKAGGSMRDVSKVPFSYGEDDFTISTIHMGGVINLQKLLSTEEEKKEWTRKNLMRWETRPPGTAWLGAGVQGSIFNDDLFEDYIFVIKRKDGKILQKDMLTPHLIYRYGFYQGGDYRIDPKEVADFFHLKGDQQQKWKDRGCI